MSTTSPTLADQIAALIAENRAAGHLPVEVAAAFVAEQTRLDAAGVPAGVLTPGSAMPDGELLDARGTRTSLTAARAGSPAAVVLYRGAWCPYCNLTLRAYEAQLLPGLAERGVRLIAVSPQTPDGSLTIAEKNALSFDVLSDPGNQIARGLGVHFEPAEEARSAQRSLGLDTTQVNADGTAGLPMPTVALVDAAGHLRWIDVHANYTTRTEPAAILAAADTLI